MFISSTRKNIVEGIYWHAISRKRLQQKIHEYRTSVDRK